MGHQDKVDHPPLFAPGFHDLSKEELRAALVDPFVIRGRRAYLLRSFLRLHAIISAWELPFELWIDGSFVTEKSIPDDIDVVLVMPRSNLEVLTTSQKQFLAKMAQDREYGKREFGVDFYVCPQSDEERLSYWREFFGHDRSGRPKGIVRLRGPYDDD